MKTVTSKRLIPAREITETKYISEDGKEFSNKTACEFYEKRRQIERHPVFATRISNVELPFTEESVRLYWFRSKDDYDYFRIYNRIRIGGDDFSTYGPGWYIFQVDDGGDAPDVARLMNLTEYCRDMRMGLSNWITDVENVTAARMRTFCGQTN